LNDAAVDGLASDALTGSLIEGLDWEHATVDCLGFEVAAVDGRVKSLGGKPEPISVAFPL